MKNYLIIYTLTLIIACPLAYILGYNSHRIQNDCWDAYQLQADACMTDSECQQATDNLLVCLDVYD